ncbi:hypothetical protein [Deinococcus aquatilis]|uniref:hypothetical protein n=1 Tax=Deinococcus aquatilis TaxID=519440 RepID=UPI000477FF78|nr:hypothetical protein [Deinococcus aquatilis]
MKSLLPLFALLTLAAPFSLAQTVSPSTPNTTTSAALNTPTPFQVDLLPFGTVTLADGSYYIPDYQGTGIGVYVQSPAPLKIATLEETVQLQTRWTRFLNPPTASTPAPVTPSLAASSTPVAPVAPAKPLVQAVASAVPVAPAPPLPVAPRPATSTSPLPDALKLAFQTRKAGNAYVLTYSVTNTSQTSVTFDPAQLVLTQDGKPLAGQLSIRNDSGTGQVLPRTAQIGVITVPARSTTPITLNWKITDAQGKQWPITYAWKPQ